jgi:hypothetical protein
MISLNRFRIKARIYSGFGALIVIGLGVAAFGGWQLAKIDNQVDRLVTVSESSSRNLETSHLTEKMRRLALRFKTMGDESAIKDFSTTQTEASELMATSVKVALTDERRRIYTDVLGKIGDLQQNFDKLVQLGTTMKADRAKLYTVGDQMTAATAQLIEAARGAGDPELIARATNVETSVLLMRIANWRFLATTDPKGPATFRTNAEKLGVAIAALEKTETAGKVTVLVTPLKAAVKDYAAAFDGTSAAVVQADVLYNNALVATTVKIGEQQVVATK